MSHTATDINQAAADLTHAFNDADWDRFRNGLAPDAVYIETGTGRRVEGVDDYLALAKG
jgi:ketosteroid isomerase-like protein